MTETTRTERQAKVEGHGGALAVAVARRRGVSAVFTAEGLAKLTRVPGLAVVTAGPGVTNSVSAVTTAWFNGSPLLVLGGRAPQARWGSGSLQELDHPPLLAPVTKRAATVHRVGDIAAEVDAALALADQPHRGPVFLDVPIEQLFSSAAVTLPDPPAPPAREPDGDALAKGVAGSLAMALDGLVAAAGSGGRAARSAWLGRLREAAAEAERKDQEVLASDAGPVHPARIYGELRKLLADDAVVIGDGGDFVSFAGRYIEPAQPGSWLDPGPYGCLGTGLGYAIAARMARPEGQVVLLLGDGAAGLSLMDVDSLVRHRLPVVIVCGNNGAWGLEKHPMRMFYGYDVAADLQPGCRYDQVAQALGGAGELVTTADGIAPALRRAFDAGVPYLVNVVTDPEVAYPRATTGL